MKIKITTTIKYFLKNAHINWLNKNHKFFFYSIKMVKFGIT